MNNLHFPLSLLIVPSTEIAPSTSPHPPPTLASASEHGVDSSIFVGAVSRDRNLVQPEEMFFEGAFERLDFSERAVSVWVYQGHNRCGSGPEARALNPPGLTSSAVDSVHFQWSTRGPQF